MFSLKNNSIYRVLLFIKSITIIYKQFKYIVKYTYKLLRNIIIADITVFSQSC